MVRDFYSNCIAVLRKWKMVAVCYVFIIFGGLLPCIINESYFESFVVLLLIVLTFGLQVALQYQQQALDDIFGKLHSDSLDVNEEGNVMLSIPAAKLQEMGLVKGK